MIGFSCWFIWNIIPNCCRFKNISIGVDRRFSRCRNHHNLYFSVFVFASAYRPLQACVYMHTYPRARKRDRSTWHDVTVLNGRVRDLICDTNSRSFYIRWKYGASRSSVAAAVPSGRARRYGMFLRSIKHPGLDRRAFSTGESAREGRFLDLCGTFRRHAQHRK